MDSSTTASIRWAALVSGGMIAFQVGSKATRDALFLSSFNVTSLPVMILGASAVALATAIGAARLMTRFGPGRTVPALFALSALLQALEWWLAEAWPRQVAVAVFLHYNALGALLISGFWSVISERFDPRTAKRVIGPVAAAGTIGGLAGGLLAERVAAWATVTTMLPLLGALHVICAVALLNVRSGEAPAAAAPRQPPVNGFRVIAGTHYLRVMVGIVLLATIAEGALDYVFKAEAREAFGRGETLLRLFAAYYTGVSLLSVVAQWLFARPVLERFGVARTTGFLPWTIALGGGLALAVPGMATAMLARGLEAVMRNSLYRAGYELLFTPLPPADKRAVRPLVDVGMVRAGDAVAAALVQAALLFMYQGALTALLALAVVAAAGAIMLTFDLHSGYVATLEKSLLHRAGQLDLEGVDDATTRSTLMRTIGFVGSGVIPVAAGAEVPDVSGSQSPPAVPPAPRVADPVLAQVTELRSRDAARVRAALAAGPLDATLAGHVIPLLAWDEVAPDAIASLRAAADRITGQLADALLDPDSEFAVRRRLPAALAEARSERALFALIRALEDRRFEVRFRSGRALARLASAQPGLTAPPDRVIPAVLREVAVDRAVWESQRLLDRLDDDGFVDSALRERASRSLEHVFTMLSLIMPRQPLQLAFRALHNSDPHLRGTALEYLESSLPPAVREGLWPFLEEAPARAPRTSRSREEILAELLKSSDSIEGGLAELRKRHSGG
jgi:AAA family ATP:ADP antiporter